MNEETFLRLVPVAINVKQRLALEALGYAIDALKIGYERIRRHLAEFSPWASETMPHMPRVALFSDVWSMIDNAHVVRSLIPLTGVDSGPTQSFVSKFEDATLLRNAMDHLSAKMNNIADAKTRRPPLYGALAYARLFGKEKNLAIHSPAEATGAYVVTIVAGSLAKDRYSFQTANILGREMEFPLGFFQFHAFDHVVNLSDLHRETRKLEDFYNNEVRVRVEDQIKKEAAAKGISESEALGHRASGLIAVMEFSFNQS